MSDKGSFIFILRRFGAYVGTTLTTWIQSLTLSASLAASVTRYYDCSALLNVWDLMRLQSAHSITLKSWEKTCLYLLVEVTWCVTSPRTAYQMAADTLFFFYSVGGVHGWKRWKSWSTRQTSIVSYRPYRLTSQCHLCLHNILQKMFVSYR